MSLHTLRQDWFSNVRNDLLAGLVAALALIPDAIAFSVIADVDPKAGLQASFSREPTRMLFAFDGRSVPPQGGRDAGLQQGAHGTPLCRSGQYGKPLR